MDLLQDQFNKLKDEFPTAELKRLPDGTALVSIRDFKLPEGKWNQNTITVQFVVPVGYPMGSPDCFWTDPHLRKPDGSLPNSTGLQNPPFEQAPKLWFSWHTNVWRPSRDNLLTFVRLIERRLNQEE